MQDHIKPKKDSEIKAAAAAAAGEVSPEEKRSKSRPKNKKRAFENAAYDEVNVLVTGFQPFGGKAVNPSWLIAKSLPPVLPVTPAHPSRIRIFVHHKPLPIVYKELERVLEGLLSDGPTQHLIIHLGVAQDATEYRLETVGHATGYTIPDVQGKIPNPSTQPAYWGEDEQLETSARMEDVFVRWQSELPGVDVRLSTDAGRYVCEYLYYSSLAFLKHKSNTSVPWNDRTTVEFLHVRDADDEASILQGCQDVIALIYSLIDSRRQRNGDFDQDGDMLD